MKVEIPQIAENVDTAEVVAVLVSVGDRVHEEQPLLELEGEKASFELPSPVDGVVDEIHVAEGDEVHVGQAALSVRTRGEEREPEPAKAPRKEPAKREEPEERKAQPKRRVAEDKDDKPRAPSEGDGSKRPIAAPKVRRLARELGVDLDTLARRIEGRITADDVRRSAEGTAPERGNGEEREPEEWGRVVAQRMSGIRRTTARRVAEGWRQVPHVTQHELVDIERLEASRRRYEAERQPDMPKLTLTAIAAKAAALALGEVPSLNSSLDLERGELLLHDYVNIGVAVDTEQGLVVPVVHHAEALPLLEIAQAIEELASRARERKLEAHEMQGATFTITNLGGIGGSAFTPIVVPPQVAILGMSRARRGMYDGGERLLLPLSLSYDHRAVDGATAMRFVARLAALLADPLRMLLVC